MTLTKDHIVRNLCDLHKIPKARAAELVEAVLEEVKTALESGEDVLITRFGKFCVKEKNGRKGRNPHTGEDLMLEPRKVVRFSASPILTSKVK